MNANECYDPLCPEHALKEDIRDPLRLIQELRAENANLYAALKTSNARGQQLMAKIKDLETALADAIRRPMGIVPASAEGLITQAEIDAAEACRQDT